MSLPAAEERALTGIEQALRSRDPRLSALFSIFTRLTRQEAMPAIEQLRRRHWRPQPGAVLLAAVALIVCAVVAGDSRRRAGAGSARHRHDPALRHRRRRHRLPLRRPADRRRQDALTPR